MQNTILQTETKTVNLNDSDFLYCLNELNKIMNRFCIHRIYRISNENDELSEAHQALEIYVNPNNEFLVKASLFIRDHLPYIYYKVIVYNRLKWYKKSLKKFMNKYKIETISTNSYSLYQGIYISNHQLCISGVDIVFESGKAYHIDKIYLDI